MKILTDFQICISELLKAKIHYAINHIWFVILASGMEKSIA